MFDWLQYLESLCTMHQEINHRPDNVAFARLIDAEAVTRLKADLKGQKQVVVFAKIESGSIEDQRADNVHLHTTLQLYFVQGYSSFRLENVQEIERHAEQIAFDFIAKIKSDYSKKIVQGFDANTVNIEPLPPSFLPNYAGVVMQLVLHKSINKNLFRKNVWQDQ